MAGKEEGSVASGRAAQDGGEHGSIVLRWRALKAERIPGREDSGCACDSSVGPPPRGGRAAGDGERRSGELGSWATNGPLFGAKSKRASSHLGLPEILLLPLLRRRRRRRSACRFPEHWRRRHQGSGTPFRPACWRVRFLSLPPLCRQRGAGAPRCFPRHHASPSLERHRHPERFHDAPAINWFQILPYAARRLPLAR
uniref:Uncharacterized protein n=1 Tax=Oryza brachyantha TaxID=4533 RepID=J3KVV5_ORYBR